MPQYTELTEEKSQFPGAVAQDEDKFFPLQGWWFHSQNWSNASILTTTEKYCSLPFLWFTIKAADSLRRNTNQFFPFSKEAEIGPTEILNSPEAEGVELRLRATCPVRGHRPLLPSLLKSIASSEVLKFNNSLEGLTESCYPDCYLLLQGKDREKQPKEETCGPGSEKCHLHYIPGLSGWQQARSTVNQASSPSPVVRVFIRLIMQAWLTAVK